MLALVADCGSEPALRLAQIEAALDAGLDWVQLRERQRDAAPLLRFADRVRALCDRVGARLLINRRVDIALSCGADGVHLGFDAASIEDVRLPFGSLRESPHPMLVGVSTHTAEEALAARDAGADYVHLAPIFTPLSKTGARPPLGPAPLRKLGERGVPVFAQGGVEVERITTLVEAGVQGVAVTGTLLDADDCGAATRALCRALARCSS